MAGRYGGAQPGSNMHDPFGFDAFHQPFAMMNQMHSMMNQMMGSFFNDPFFNPGFPQQQQAAPRRLGPSSTIIEEVHDDHPATGDASQPIVEEPDEVPRQQGHSRRDQAYQHATTASHGLQPPQFPGLYSGMGGSGGQVYSYSSSSVYSNQNGVTYQKSTTARMGPGGVQEMQSTERDGRTGKESITIARALGYKARTITRTRDSSGRETSQDLLRGIGQDEANRFDDEWRQTAERNLLSGRHAIAAAPSARRAQQPQLQYQPQLAGSTAGMSGRQPGNTAYGYSAYDSEPLGRSKTVGRYV